MTITRQHSQKIRPISDLKYDHFMTKDRRNMIEKEAMQLGGKAANESFLRFHFRVSGGNVAFWKRRKAI